MVVRAFNVFGVGFLASFATLFAAWIALDGLWKLDGFVEAAGPDRSWLGVAIVHYEDVIRLQGATLFGAVALASVAFGTLASKRFVGSRSEVAG